MRSLRKKGKDGDVKDIETYQSLDGCYRLFFENGIKSQRGSCELIKLHGLGIMRW